MDVRKPQQGDRGLSIWICTALVAGNMIGSGIFLLPALLAPFGAIGILGWLFTALGALLLALTLGRLSRAMPSAGGPYAFTRRGFGDFAAFLVVWGYWISLWTGNAAIAVAFVGYLGALWPTFFANPVGAAGVALSAVWGLTALNCSGVRNAGRVQVVTTVLKLLPLVAFATLGLLFIDSSHFVPFNASSQSTFSAVSACAALTFWAFMGLESATIPVTRVHNPERTVPRATLWGTVVTATVYILSTTAVLGIVHRDALASSTAPFADAARVVWGGWAGQAVALGAAVSCLGALNGWILIQGQWPLAAARDRLFPSPFRRLSRRGTPAVGLIISSCLVTVLILMNFARGLVEMFKFMILLATLTALVPYAFSSMAELMILIQDGKGFRNKKRAGAAVMASLAFLYSIWVIGGSGRDAVYWGFLLLLSGIPVYVWLRHQGMHTPPVPGNRGSGSTEQTGGVV